MSKNSPVRSAVKFLNTLMLLTLSSIVVSQVLPELELPSVTKGALPNWVKEGVCVVYQLEGGSRLGIGAESSSSYLGGYTVYVVLTIQDKIPYGLEILYFRDMRGAYSIKTSLKPLVAWRSFLYMDVAGVKEFLKDRQLHAQYGVLAEGGPLPDGTLYFATTRKAQDEVATSSYIYTADGVIKMATHTKQHARGADAAKITLVGIHQLNLPKLPMPDISRQSPTYVQAYRNFYGQVEPWAYHSLRFVRVDREIVDYTVTTSGRISGSSEAIGTALFGPFYINPQLLRSSTIISVPDVGFHMRVTGTGPNGGSVVTVSFENQPVAYFEYDSRTGLLLYYEYMDANFRNVLMLVGK